MISVASKTIKEYAFEYGIEITPEMCGQFELYAKTLIEWNTRINLTAITDPDEIIVKHFLDSLLPLIAVEIPRNASIIDVGTGAGFPGVPLKIARPDLRLTLLDSLKKRVGFLSQLSGMLNQDNVLLHERAEHLARQPGFREHYDIAVSRALAALPSLCEYCLPLVRPGGSFLALKGPGAHLEASAAENPITLLGGKLEDIKSFNLPSDNERRIVIIKKISQTSSKYPRTGVKISKKPL